MIIKSPTAAELPALRRLWQQAFGDPDSFVDRFFAKGFSADRCRCLWENKQPAAALYWFDCSWQGKKVAYLYAVATDVTFRGKGLCRQLMEDTHRHLQAAGYAGAALVPGNRELFSLYEKLGYRSFCPMQIMPVTAENNTISPEKISADEFDALRRSLLPENALVQDGPLTEFLSAFSGLYKVEGAVFSASKEGNTLHFQEFLGDPALLPGIIAGLQAETGVVRLPGGNTHTAMYRSFDDSDALPDYLGISLN